MAVFTLVQKLVLRKNFQSLLVLFLLSDQQNQEDSRKPRREEGPGLSACHD